MALRQQGDLCSSELPADCLCSVGNLLCRSAAGRHPFNFGFQVSKCIAIKKKKHKQETERVSIGVKGSWSTKTEHPPERMH